MKTGTRKAPAGAGGKGRTDKDPRTFQDRPRDFKPGAVKNAGVRSAPTKTAGENTDRARAARAEELPENLLLGLNPVREALKSGRPVDKVLLAEGDRSARTGEIMALARDSGVPVQKVDRARLDFLSGNARHQGVLAYVAAHGYVSLEDILARAGDVPPLVLLLDEINDPHNLGAILRTAEAAGVHGVVITKRRSVSLTPAVARVSAGAVEYVPVARVANLVQTIETLKERGMWVVGADAGGRELYWQARLDGPLALVVGGEDKGLGRLVREKCDLLVKLPMLGRINSLNASVASALMMYEVVRQRGFVHGGVPHS